MTLVFEAPSKFWKLNGMITASSLISIATCLSSYDRKTVLFMDFESMDLSYRLLQAAYDDA